MNVKVKILIMSHLSDVQEVPNLIENQNKLNFAKYLVMVYSDTNVYVNADTVYNEFKELYPHLVK
jgi:hypothetical protein